MRKFLKNNILEIFQTIYEAHIQIKKLIEKKDFESAQIVIGDCQNAAVQIGTAIENSEGEDFIAIGFLEEYCETAYEVAVSISEEYNSNKVQKRLDKVLIKAENSVKNDVKVKLEVVFCPYKASMWDSLESVWKAANEDPDCDAYVVPIPYYDRNPDHSFGEYHYEGGDYPGYVPIVHYEAYDFEKRRPDVVYIHNPYDDSNYVTSVDPRFYSSELKKYTDKLVYIPYFFTNLEYSDTHLFLPVYKYVDAIIVQNEVSKQQFKDSMFYKKVYTFGSPKLDCIINYYDQKRCPYQLSEIAGNKKIIFFNTSISFVLKDTNLAFNKIEYLIKEFVESDNIFVVWRPHPLLEATLKSMRPKAYEILSRLKNMFLKQCIGIYDIEMNIDELVAVSDAYVGEESSSVVMLFASLGKPVFIINDNMFLKDEYNECFFDFFIKDDYCYFADSNYKSICKADFTTGKVLKIMPVDYHDFSKLRAYTTVKFVDDKLWFAPMNGKEIPIYSINDDSLQIVDFSYNNIYNMPNYNNIIPIGNDLYFIPVRNDHLLKINAVDYKKTYYDRPVERIKKNASDVGFYSMFASCLRNDIIYIASPLSNKVIAFDPLNDSVKEYEVGRKDKGYWHMVSDGDNIWLLPYCGRAIVKWNPDSHSINEYDEYPEYFNYNDSDKDYFIQIVDCDEYLLAFPKRANMIINIDKKSGKMSKFDADFGYEEGTRKNQNYSWESNYYFAKRIGNVVYALSAFDHSLISIDIHSKKVSKKYFTISKDVFDYAEGIVREKSLCTDVRKCFYDESANMTLAAFINMLKNDKITINGNERELVAADFANPNGISGKVIHEFSKKDLI